MNAYKLEIIRTKLAEPAAQLDSPRAVARRYSHLARYDRERLVRLDLDTRNQLIGEEVVSIGITDAAMISPREVFRGALLNGATHIILIHNHPSGDPSPSDDDFKAQEILKEAGRLLNVQLQDFLVIGDNGRYWSTEGGSGQVEVKEQGNESTTPEVRT